MFKYFKHEAKAGRRLAGTQGDRALRITAGPRRGTPQSGSQNRSGAGCTRGRVAGSCTSAVSHSPVSQLRERPSAGREHANRSLESQGKSDLMLRAGWRRVRGRQPRPRGVSQRPREFMWPTSGQGSILARVFGVRSGTAWRFSPRGSLEFYLMTSQELTDFTTCRVSQRKAPSCDTFSAFLSHSLIYLPCKLRIIYHQLYLLCVILPLA